jgi:RND family efflux transporter MFP subunit
MLARSAIQTTPIAAALAVSLALAACSGPAPVAAPPKPVRVQPVVLSTGTSEDSYTGAVRARVETDLAFRVGGKVIRRAVEVGQRVRAGDLLAELDAADYGLNVAAALNQQQATAVDAEQAASDAARFARLHADGAVSAGDAERQKARADAARERLEQARRGVELARNRAAYALLRAPFDGVVTALRFEAGQVVAEGQPVISLAAAGEREIVVDIPETQVLAARRSPQAVASLFAGDGARFAVTLRELAPLASAATRTYRARYRVGGVGVGAPAMELGMTATVWLRTPSGDAAAAAPVATLPASALHHRDGRTAVWMLATPDASPVLTPVEVLRYAQDEVQVSGLAAGQLVVTAGVQKITPSMAVVAVNAEGQPIARGAVAAAPLAAAAGTGASGSN